MDVYHILFLRSFFPMVMVTRRMLNLEFLGVLFFYSRQPERRDIAYMKTTLLVSNKMKLFFVDGR